MNFEIEKMQGNYRWNRFHSRRKPSRRGKVTRRGACDDLSSIMACQGAGEPGIASCTSRDGGSGGAQSGAGAGVLHYEA